jgi:hypothetical protein
MKSIEELKSIFLQERINYWKCAKPELRITVHTLINELETIQVIIGKPQSNSQEPLACDKSKEPPCHLEPSKDLCQKCPLEK